MVQKSRGLSDEPLVVTTRGGVTENVHRGRICIVSADDGKLLEAIGDTDATTFFRSAGKPLQAIGPLLSGVAEAYGWEERHFAMMTASQKGLPVQLQALQEMKDSAGIAEDAFAFGAVAPGDAAAREAWARAGGQRGTLYHTCAGKHLGMLAWSKLAGWPLERYWEESHPSQQETLKLFREWTGAGDDDLEVAKDGCGLPVAAVPLRLIALAYARLACPERAPNERLAVAASRTVAAMNAFPDLVEAPGRLASILLSDQNIVAKSGAQGLFALGLREQRIGIVVHLSDGTEMPWGYVVTTLLEKYGGASERTMELLRSRYPANDLNDAREIAGRRESMFLNGG